MILKTQAIKNFLNIKTHQELADLYNFNMEVQILVAQDNGQRIDGVYKGKQWSGFSDEYGSIWKSFRIPYNAKDNPSYEDKEINFDLNIHTEGIGMTGWDWNNKLSRWFAFDFDSLVGHSDKHKN
mgnify:FL=1